MHRNVENPSLFNKPTTVAISFASKADVGQALWLFLFLGPPLYCEHQQRHGDEAKGLVVVAQLEVQELVEGQSEENDCK